MKRSVVWIIAAVMVMLCVTPALADGPWSKVLQAGRTLATDTTNVTLTLHADFSYNRQHFKTVSLRYIQDDVNSLLDLVLNSLRTDDTSYESGYVVHCLDGVMNVIPDRRSAKVETRLFTPKDRTLLTLTPSQESYLNTALQLAGLMDSLMSRGVRTERTEAGETIYLRFEQDVSIGLMDSLTLSLVREAAERYLDFREVPEAVGVNTAYTPYDYTGLSVEYWDWDAAYAREYEAFYGEAPDAGRMNDAKVMQSLAREAAEKSSPWTTGMVRILEDGSTEYYPTYDDYIRQTGSQYIRYEDVNESLTAYYRMTRGEELSLEEATGLYALRREMDAYYGALLREHYPRNAACGAVFKSGKLVPYDSVRLTNHAFETYTQQILRAMSELRWGNGEFDCTLDKQGRLTQITGEFMWQVVNHTGDSHPLMVTFTLTLDHYGDSKVPPFLPQEWKKSGE